MLDSHADAGEPLPAELPHEKGTPSVPDPTEAKLPEDATEEDLIIAALQFELETRVLAAAKADFPISSECSANGGDIYECVVMFNDNPVNFTAEVTDVDTTNYGGVSELTRFSYELVEEQTVVTKNAVLIAMADTVEQAADSDTPLSNPRCDADIPDVTVVDAGSDIEQFHCYAKPEGYSAWPNFTREYIIAAQGEGVSLWHD